MWGIWWLPVRLFEGAGFSGPWIGFAMSAATLPVAAVWCMTQRGAGFSSRTIIGGLLIGLAVTFYAIAVSYTDFIRAMLLFYFAPAWSTLIELIFMGRRWRLQSMVAIAASLAGVILVTRGEISLDGLGAVGDWMALVSGLSWSIGVALVFNSKRPDPSRVFLWTGIGGVGAAIAVAFFDGSFASGIPVAILLGPDALWPYGFATVYVGIILAGTIWGAFKLPPAVMSYLLSFEIIGGVLSATLLLGDPFGWFEALGAVCIVGAVLIEVLWTERIAKSGTQSF